VTPADGITAIIRAGPRPGQLDPRAIAAGTAHKAMLRVAGVALPSHLLGFQALVPYALRRASLDGMLRPLSARTGQRLAVVEIPFAEAAVDVDKPEDLALVETIFAHRAVA